MYEKTKTPASDAHKFNAKNTSITKTKQTAEEDLRKILQRAVNREIVPEGLRRTIMDQIRA